MRTSRGRTVEVRQLAGHLGARVAGVDISQLSEEAWAAVRSAFDDHAVIVLPGQSGCTRDAYLDFASRWGPLLASTGDRLTDNRSPLVILENLGPNVTDIWHSDLSYQEEPPLATMLLADAVPPAGGDTVFASQVAAYAALTPAWRAFLGGFEALHVDLPRGDGKPFEARTRAVHPVVRLVNGVPALYVNSMYTHQIVGMSGAESRTLLDWLFSHCTHLNFTFRHTWSAGDLLIWDNRRVQHFAIHDYGDQVRRMYRLVVAEKG